jgi:hypothetical protein
MWPQVRSWTRPWILIIIAVNLSDIATPLKIEMSLPFFDFSILADGLCSVASSQSVTGQKGCNKMCDMQTSPPMVGIGALLATIEGLKDSPWYVCFVPEGSTAHVAGLEPGDLVIQVRITSYGSVKQCVQ